MILMKSNNKHKKKKGANNMANRTINTNQLVPGTPYMIRGKVTYCRMLHKIDGEELRKDNERRRAQNRPEATKAYTTITIKDAQVVRANPNIQETPIELYARESLYQNKTTGSICFTVENKGREPWFAKHQNDDIMNPNIQQFCPIAELASGMDVTLVMEVYQSKPNNGVGLQGIIINEPVKYFTGKGAPDPSALASLGLTFTPASATEISASMEERKNMAPVGLEDTEDAMSASANPTPITQPVGDPYSYNPAAAQTQTAPQQAQVAAQQVQPQPAPMTAPQAYQSQYTTTPQYNTQSQMSASVQTSQNQKIQMPQYTDMPTTFSQQTMAQATVPQQPGIRYNPNNRQY